MTVTESKPEPDTRTKSTEDPIVESKEKVFTGEESHNVKTESCDPENRSPKPIVVDDESCGNVQIEKNCDKNLNRNFEESESERKAEADQDEQTEKTYPSAPGDEDPEAPKMMNAEDSTVTKNQILDNGTSRPAENSGNEAHEAKESGDSEKLTNFSKVAENSLSGVEESKENLVDGSVTGDETTERNLTRKEATEFVESTNEPQGSAPEGSESVEVEESSEQENEANGVEYAELKSAIEMGKDSSVMENPKDADLDGEKPTDQEKRTKEICDGEETIKNGESLLEVEKASDSTCSRISAVPESPQKQRSVIEDIFDDWQDDNVEEEQQQLSKSHDSVEMELKILLHDEKSTDGTCHAKDEAEASSQDPKERASSNQETLEESCEKTKMESSRIEEKGERMESRKSDKTSDLPIARERLMKQKPLAPRPGVKVPGILLTSPIVSKSAVSKVLKERIREQQKEFDSPTKPDLFFVKKITQRLSHKLAAASAAQVPGLLPIPQISKSSSTTSETKKTASNVDKELLAILEGDVDPDWSNLKVPSSVVEEAKSTGDRNSSTKLDPSIEREIALKQLLELPSNASKKVAAKKTPTKAARSKIGNSAKTMTQNSKKDGEEDGTRTETTTVTNLELKEDSMDSNQSQEYKSDETRSGRKRKPTEKAREHENSTKRMKVFKAKTPSNKRKILEDESSMGEDSRLEKNEEESISEKLEEAAKKRVNDAATLDDSVDSRSEESSSELVDKKVTLKPNTKRKLQKIAIKKKSGMRKMATGLTKKTGTKMSTVKGQKQRNGETSQAEAKPKKKTINEIDRLLQDEGVVNLLYDVEHSDKKRLVPITKSQTKVMDLQKIQRELKIRTKLVRNAVLRLRTSNIPSNKVSPRSKRTISHSIDFYSDKKSGDSKIASPTSPTDFIYPAKIRNAADASIIIRRHSSSSFSSASASPRASIDAPERLSIDGSKIDDASLASHGLRSNKRRFSHEDGKKKKKAKQSPEPKRNRRKTIDRSDSEAKFEEEETLEVFNVPTKTNKTTGSQNVSANSTPLKAKKIESKKNQKSPKQQPQLEPIDIDENSSGSSAKVATRSNATLAAKITPKSKKPAKCKVTFAKGNESVNKKMDSPGQQDELSACLAEAVTALSNDNGGSSRSRSTIPVNRNKTKGTELPHHLSNFSFFFFF